MNDINNYNELNIILIFPIGVTLRRQRNRGFLIGKGIVFLLNSSALRIIEQCDGKNSIQEVLDNLRNSFVFKENYDFQSEVVNFIRKLIDANVIMVKGGNEYVSRS